MKQLRTGTNLIRFLLVLGIFTSLAGLFLLSQPNHDPALLAVLFGGNVLSLGVVIRILLVRKLTVRIKEISNVMDRAAEGELADRVYFDGETEMSVLADNLNSMLDRLSDVIAKIHSSLAELRNISSTLGGVSEEGVASAARQEQGVKQISTAIREINQSINDVSASITDLSGHSSGNSSSMAAMYKSLESTTRHLESLGQSVEGVSSSILEMASAVHEIEDSAAILVTDTVKTAELAGEMDMAIKRIGIQAYDTSRIAETVKNDAEEGRKTVDAAIAGIKEISSSSSVAFDAIENLSQRVANIGTILSFIDEVAEQTNLLSLNASIIAAQAGERGKSFSVVAGEIKQLAKRTGSHTKEISEIIMGVREETERAVKAITLSGKRIEEGGDLSRRSGEALSKIVNGIQEASARMVEINATAVSQAKSSEAVQKAMANVVDLVGQIACATQEQSHGSKMISSEVSRMREITHEVIHTIDRHKSSANQVITASGTVNDLVALICETTILQSTSAQRIVDSITDLEESSGLHVKSTMVTDEIMLNLSRQISLLETEISHFKIK